MNQIPRFCYAKNLGKCRVLDYLGNGKFRILTKGDQVYIRDRSLIRFYKEKSA